MIKYKMYSLHIYTHLNCFASENTLTCFKVVQYIRHLKQNFYFLV